MADPVRLAVLADAVEEAGARGGLVSHFFFSSRRRHTRLSCDWSPDVCSSDLTLVIGFAAVPSLGAIRGPSAPKTAANRSGKRRAGKECRTRWAPHHSKKS